MKELTLVTTTEGWLNAWPHVTTDYSEGVIGFTCVCGQKDLSVDDEGEKQTCPQCGRIYRCSLRFEFREDTQVSVEGASWALDNNAVSLPNHIEKS